MPEDPKPPQPDQPSTIRLDAVQVLSELIRGVAADVKASREETAVSFVAVKADFNLLAGQFDGLERDVRGMQSWRVRVDDRLTSNSVRAQATTGVDLAQDAKLAQALMQLGEAKARCEKLEEEAATKKDLEALGTTIDTKIGSAALAQNAAIIAGVKSFVSKPLVQKIGYAAGVLLLQVLTLGTAYLAMKGH